MDKNPTTKLEANVSGDDDCGKDDDYDYDEEEFKEKFFANHIKSVCKEVIYHKQVKSEDCAEVKSEECAESIVQAKNVLEGIVNNLKTSGEAVTIKEGTEDSVKTSTTQEE